MSAKSNRCAVARAAAVLAEDPGLTIGQLMQAARCSSGTAMRAMMEVSEPAVIVAKPVAVPAETKCETSASAAGPEMRHGDRPNGKAPSDAERAPPPRVAKRRARALVHERLKYGPRPGAQIEAAAQAADIPKPALLAVTDELGVRSRRGEWRLPR